jgi:hypothetical protein
MKDIFLRIEDRARRYFERIPFIHAFLAGVGVILFWRGVWEIADIYSFDPTISIIVGIIILVSIGLFTHTFIGNAIIIKSVKHEINIEKENRKDLSTFEKNINNEEITLAHLSDKIDQLSKKITHIEEHLH